METDEIIGLWWAANTDRCFFFRVLRYRPARMTTSTLLTFTPSYPLHTDKVHIRYTDEVHILYTDEVHISYTDEVHIRYTDEFHIRDTEEVHIRYTREVHIPYTGEVHIRYTGKFIYVTQRKFICVTQSGNKTTNFNVFILLFQAHTFTTFIFQFVLQS